MKRRKILFVVVTSIGGFAAIMINTFVHQKIEINSQYNFVISKIKVTPTYRMTLLDGNGEAKPFWNYTIMNYEDVKVGDAVFKDSCSEFLYILRKDQTGKYIRHKKIAFTGAFPYKWFSK